MSIPTNRLDSTNSRQTDFFSKNMLWTREIFVLCYVVFAAIVAFYHLFPNFRPAYLLLCLAEAIYAPAILFAAGYSIGITGRSQKTTADFRKKTLKNALACLLLFYGIGFCQEVFLRHRASFATIKDLLAFNRIPIMSAIFLTLSALFLLCAFLWPYFKKCLEKRWLVLSIGFIGFLFSFIPEEILGYGIVGVFIGGDRFGCIPLAPYLIVILGGIAFGSGKFTHLLHKGILLLIGVCYVFGALLLFLHFKQPALILLGIGTAYVALLISRLFLGLYERAESLFERFLQKMLGFWKIIQRKKAGSRPFELLLYYIGYGILFLIIAAFIFAPYLEQNTTLIWSVDGLGQYVPKIYRFMSYIPSVLRDLLHGSLDFQQYDFTSGLGATVSISFDPIYWLYLLFDTSQIESVYSGMIVLRFFLAGASMSAMLLYFKKSSFAAYTGSIAYAFSGYAIYAGTRHGQFLTPLILLPILVIAMEQLISKKKWYLLTIFTALSLLCSYYFLYMNTIALGIYFVVRILCTKELRNFKTFFTRGLIIVGSYILGASIGVISLFTSFGSYMGSSRTEGSSFSEFLSTTPFFYRTEWIPDFFISFISDSYAPGLWLKLGFTPAAFLLLVLLFTRKNKKELKPLFIIFTIFCIFPIFGFIFSGFSSVNNRWCYIYAVVIAFILAEHLEKIPKLTGLEIKIMTGMVALYGGIIFFSTKYRTDKVFGAYALLLLTFVVILLLNHDKIKIPKRAGKILLFTITMFSIVMNANLFITSTSDTGSHMATYVPFGKSLSRMSKTALKYLDEVTEDTDEDFYRSTNLENYGSTRSTSLIYGYNDLATFTSTLGGSIVNYNSAMGNCDWNIVSIYSYNFRTYMNELASVRYLGVSSADTSSLPYGYSKVYEKKKKKETYSIYENDYTLPLGYTYSNVTKASEASSCSAAEKQELTMLTAIVDDDKINSNENIGEASVSSLPMSAHPLEITDIKLKGVTMEDDTITIDGAGSSITFYFDGEANSETYLSFGGDIYAPKDAAEHFLKTIVKADGVRYQYKFRIDSYNTGQEEYLFNLGYHEDAINSCTLKFQSDGILKYTDIAIYSQSMDTYADRVNALKANSLENVKAEKNTVTGDITVDEDKMLVISLPYQSGWTAYVDGKESEIQKVNYQYMGLNLSKGTHTIRLHYQLPGLKLAFIITGLGIGVFLFIILFNWIRKRGRRIN